MNRKKPALRQMQFFDCGAGGYGLSGVSKRGSRTMKG